MGKAHTLSKWYSFNVPNIFWRAVLFSEALKNKPCAEFMLKKVGTKF